MKKVGICFSKELQGVKPLGHIGTKLPVYLRLLDFMKNAGWEVYVLTRKTYKNNGVFEGGWRYDGGSFLLTNEKLTIDLVYDRTGGIDFPPESDNLLVVNPRNFKILCWDKWATFKEIEEFMPKTLLIENEKQIAPFLSEIKSDKIVLKPFNGLKGLGVFIGDKDEALDFKFPEKYSKYVMQEFVDTSGGIPGITSERHDLRVAVVNQKVVWCHVRVPKEGSLMANAAQGGSLTEVDYEKVPKSVKNIVEVISRKFYNKYGNTIYSLDFGVEKDGTPKIFEINDQIGFPKWDMKEKDSFLLGLISNFKQKLEEK